MNLEAIMKVRIEEMQNGIVLKLNGNIIGIPDETEFNNVIKNLAGRPNLNLVIDLGNISYINSTAWELFSVDI